MTIIAAIRSAASSSRNGLAIVHGADRRTWKTFAHDVAATAGALRSAGLRPGEHVATLALNSPRYLEVLMAVWWAGGVIVPLNTRLAYAEQRFILEHSDSKLLVADVHFWDTTARARNDLACLDRVMVLDDDTRAAMLAHPTIDDQDPPLESLAGIFYTGGTTGLPKGVELTHGNFLCAAADMMRDTSSGPDCVYLHAAPLFHVGDFGTGLGVTLGAGGHSFIAQFSAREFYQRLREDRVTHLQFGPTILAMIIDAPERDDRLLSQIKSVSYGTAPITQTLLARLLQAFPNARVQQFYGMTEYCGASTLLPPDRHVLDGPNAGKLLSAGRALPGFEVRITDNALQPCPLGVTGEIQMRGPGVTRGYWKDPAKTAETLLPGGWLRSGDAGYMDEDGFVYVVDRLKDMIISGGENIYCGEVENALTGYPGVEACAVIGVPDALWGERVHAVVIPKAGAQLVASDLDAHCRARIAGYKVPRSYDIRAEPLPLSGVGKVQKNRLRDEWLAKRGTSQ
jgi:acyl-CoA synthetase (AMP-forming)/AMP-acid ligase II